MSSNNPDSLRSRVLNATGWAVGQHGLTQLLRFLANLLLTRLLVPEMFGLMVVANILIAGMTMFSDIGLNMHLIQHKRGADRSFINTAWTVQIIRGLILSVITLLLAYLVVKQEHLFPEGSVYSNPELPTVLAILAISPLIDGFKSTKLAISDRNMDMKSVAKVHLVSQVVGLTVMVLGALAYSSIYALIAGGLISKSMTVALSHLSLKGTNNRLHWDSNKASELFHFGKWIFITSILGFLVANGDRLLLALYIDASTLGIYSIAVALINIILGMGSSITDRVGFAALSDIARNNPGRLREIYYRIRLPLDAIFLFIAGMLFMVGNSVVDWFYDDRYSIAGNMVEILSFSIIFSRYSLYLKLNTAIGKPRLNVPVNLINLLALYCLLPVGVSLVGLQGSLWVIALYKAASIPFIFYLKVKSGVLDIARECYVFGFYLIGLLIGYITNLIYIAYIG